MITTVIVPIKVIGFHKYPKAPKKVSFLRARHRHVFHIKIHYKVTDLNREKEIFMMADQVIDYLYEAYGNPCEFGNMSCEHIANEVLEFSKDDGAYKVEVLEDGDGGASVELVLIEKALESFKKRTAETYRDAILPATEHVHFGTGSKPAIKKRKK